MLAVIATALGLFTIPGALATGSDDHQNKVLEPFPHPVNPLVKAQTPLLEIVDALDAFLAEHEIAGFVGARVEPEHHKLFIFWHGDVPGEVEDFVGQFSDRGHIKIIQVPLSLEELTAETIRVLEENPGFADGGPNENFDGLVFTVAQPDESYDFDGMESHLSDVTGLPVAVEAGDWAQSTDFHRANDVSPFWGGAVMASEESLCTTGFAARKQATDQEVLISANHCEFPEPGDDWVTKDGDRFIGRVADEGHRDLGLDTILLTGEDYDSAVYVGGPFSNRGAPVVGASRNVVGAIITNSGGFSGEVGNNRIQLVNQFIRLDTDQDGDLDLIGPGTWSLNQEGVAQAGPGDSGGPQVRPVVHPDNPDKWALHAQNINTAIDIREQFVAECEGRDPERGCSTRAFGVDINAILGHFKLNLP